MKFLSNYDLMQNQLMNAVVHRLPTPPVNPAEGQIYYDTIEKRQFTFNGTKWVGNDASDAYQMNATDIVTLINASSEVIDDNNLSAEVNDAIARKHSHDNKALLDTYTVLNADLVSAVELKHLQNTDTGTNSVTFTIGEGGVKVATVEGKLNVRNNANSAFADLVAANVTANGNLTVTGDVTIGTGANRHLINTLKTTITTSGKKTDVGAESTNVFEIVDGSAIPNNLFEVRQNGDTVIGGILTVNGTGTSSFAGDVNIGGALSVKDGIVGGTTMELGEDLVVKGNTILGDDAQVDTTTVYGSTTVHSGYTKAAVVALVDTWKTNHAGYTPEELRAYVATLPDVFAVVDGSEVKDADGVVITPAVPLLQVKGNGDTIFGGVLTVNGDGESFFAGDVRIGGDQTVEGGLTVLGDATVQAILTQDDMRIVGNLDVEGSTTLGNDASSDVVNINGITTITTSTDKAAIDAAVDAYVTANPNATEEQIDTYKQSLVGYIDVFAIKDSKDADIFQVKGNGDTVIGGVLTVNGSGQSSFAGDVNIGGALSVKDGIVGGTTMQLGEDLTVEGTLKVYGDTLLGDDASIDKTTIKGVTTVVSPVTKAAGQTADLIFKVVDSEATALFSVATNGDTTVGGALTVNNGATVHADFTGDNLNLSGNLVVNGNTTLGNEATDTLTVVAKTILPTSTTIGEVTYAELYNAVGLRHTQNTDTGTNSETFAIGTDGILIQNAGGVEARLRNADNSDYVDLRVKNLFVEGESTVIQSNIVSIGDSEIELNGDITTSATNSDGGITIKRLKSGDETRADAKLTYNNSTNRWQTTQGDAESQLVTAIVANKIVKTIGDGVNTEFVITHNLNTRDLTVGIRMTSSPFEMVMTDVEMTSLNSVTIKFAGVPEENEFTVTIIG